MFESIKTKVWELLQGKDVSLAMFFNREGNILWHRGREIRGKTVQDGEGFSKSYIAEAMRRWQPLEEENVIVVSGMEDLTRSGRVLSIKSLIILPVGDNFFLYVDSGVKEAFSNGDRDVFRVVGELLGEMIRQVRKNESDIGGISGGSPEIMQIRELVLRYSIEEDPVLLLGETGVGKSRIAELIHRFSGRKGKFFTVSTPSIPDNLFESEIFGHRKGAFTDARSDKRGFVDEASGGTLFFDEIAEIPLSFQAKLLRFIETRKYQVLGEPSEREADVRLLAATNRDLRQAIKSNLFREDLYFRLQVLEIEIPPLRRRMQDIRELVAENLKLLRGKEIGTGFWKALNSHDWPGNARELITVLTRAGIDIPSPIHGDEIGKIIARSCHEGITQGPDETMKKKAEREIHAGKSFWEVVWKPFILREFNKNEVRGFLSDGYATNHFHLKKLSESLNIRTADYKKFVAVLHKYGIHPKKID